jgi:hypothetical protein
MSPVRYTTRIFPDGHLPLPDGFTGKVGEEIQVTLQSGIADLEQATAEQRSACLLECWAGRARGTGEGVSARHDEFLYGQ